MANKQPVDRAKRLRNAGCFVAKDISSQKFGRLTAIRFSHLSQNKTKLHYWLFKCDCKNEKILSKNEVVRGKAKSCGCLFRDMGTTHGCTNTLTYQSWESMKKRCLNKNNRFYKNYGGRGIKVCDRWLNSFENFLEDMGKKPIRKTIDRINNNGNYEPSNCRWITKKDQCNNKSNNLSINFKGKTQSLTQWCEKYKLKYNSTYYHIKKGKDIKQILKMRGIA